MSETSMSDDINSVAQRIARASRIADRAAVTEIQSEAVGEPIAGVLWYDISHMLNPHEHPPESIDIARELIDHAIDRRLVIPHPTQKHLVRVAN